ncbi:FKBP-like protein [Glarea lozoyensis ATCC 20868]|uniref:peptidylprolyl isomerase n=2 Tax=Glarea lozoyensis TaxID=101852 RepID=S3D425_GLAL2|nr:FKBP-like protein [Glarea lozoyensis ATCC 20868]EHL00853.1 putative FK506-binding protein 4 [Glarea lozoyensis 74030]EPE26781.1 FKBP-like protein [Glarea lozoyensis ATCC 20868]
MPFTPVALYGLEVPCGDVMVPATPDFPASFRITMAAIDPTEAPEVDDKAEGTSVPRATLKIVRTQASDDDDEEDNEEYMRALLAESDSDDSESEEEANGGPSDPAKSKKARKQAALEQLMQSIKDDGSDEEMEDAATNGTKVSKKGKSKLTDDDDDEEEEDSDEDSDDGEELEIEEFVLCTLDPEKHYQQTLDITVGENEKVYFKVTGTHAVYLTGNFLIPDDDGHNHHHEVYDSEDDEDDEDYDLSPAEDELEMLMDDDEESDDLDAFENPRITEVDSEEEAPKLVAKADKKAEKKGKNKRSAEEIEEPASLDDIMAKSLKSDDAEEPKLSKKQLKKLKKNNGEASSAKVEESKAADGTPKSDKKVQFAKNLEQGPTGSAEKAKPAAPAKEAPKPAVKAAEPTTKVLNGVKMEDKKVGKGRACKKGDKVGMRYIGKLTDGKVFDSNKSGKPFSFKLGTGEVIKGWDIGVAGMAVGGERRITIPAQQGYGSQKIPGIPPNSTLVFDVKLMEIK